MHGAKLLDAPIVSPYIYFLYIFNMVTKNLCLYTEFMTTGGFANIKKPVTDILLQASEGLTYIIINNIGHEQCQPSTFSPQTSVTFLAQH